LFVISLGLATIGVATGALADSVRTVQRVSA